MHRHSQSGFTLIELAIVIVIIGLLVGGILVGQDLISGGKRSAVISEVDAYKSAIRQFRESYSHLPGDMPNASRYWPNCDGTPANCNGDGNGQVSGTEILRAWQQLSDSEIINHSFSGTGNADIGTTIPAAAIDGAGYDLLWDSGVGLSEKRNLLRLSADQGAAMGGGIISGENASAIDAKTDDGLPTSGAVQATSASGCTNAGPPVTYIRTKTDLNCVLLFYTE